MVQETALKNISIVLVHTRTPANIGAVARCMMNMGLSKLVLVGPPADENNDAVRLAAGADTILECAGRFSTLSDALSGHSLVFGTSRHLGKQRKNVRTPRDSAEEIISHAGRNRTAIVFGNEVNGLENEELALCNEIISISSSRAFPSLNLSHAVMVVAYELFLAAGAEFSGTERELAPSEELEEFYRHLQVILQGIGFLGTEQPERIMFSLRQLFGRSRPDRREVKILRGILRQINWAVKERRD